MSTGGKGSAPRPFSVSNDEYSARWDAIFARDKEHIGDDSAQKQNLYVTPQPVAWLSRHAVTGELAFDDPDNPESGGWSASFPVYDHPLPIKTYTHGKPWPITPEE